MNIFKRKVGGITASSVIGLVIACVLFAVLIPVAIEAIMTGFANASQLGGTGSEPFITNVISLGQMIALFVILAFVVSLVYGLATRKGN